MKRRDPSLAPGATGPGPSRATTRAPARAPAGLGVRRIIGRYGDDTDGPLVLCVGGLHGNEPSGIVALQRVLARLRALRPPFRGRLIGVAGNLPALRAGRRFIDRDLNRGWNLQRVAALLEAPTSTEDREQAALVELLVPAIRAAAGTVVVLDLHTTSSASPPFVTLSDTLEGRSLARRLGMPVVLGLEEEIDTMADYLSDFGAAAIGIESGRHDDPAAVEVHEAALWVALASAGCFPDSRGLEELQGHRRRIERARRGLPDVFEVVHRCAIRPNDGFRMDPGFENFTRVRAGQVVAADERGPVSVPVDGRLFLPLYQAQGDDGFFVVRRVRPVWLWVSRLLRRLGVPAVLPLLPGVRRSPIRPDTLLVSRRIARWRVAEIFHLLGYRRVPGTGDRIAFRGRGTRSDQASSTSDPESAER